jgi:maltose phosphorylase
MRVRDNQLRFNPILPAQWTSFSFRIGFRGVLLQVKVNKEGVQIINQSNQSISVAVYDRAYHIPAQSLMLAAAGDAG